MPRKKPTSVVLADLIRSAFADSGMSRFELSKRSGVSYSVTHRFITGERSVRLETADKMLAGLGLEVRLVQSRKRG